MTETRLITVMVASAYLGGCAESPRSLEWVPADNGWYLVPKGTDPRTISAAAKECGALVDGAMAHHIAVPEGYDWGLFKFLPSTSEAAKYCTVSRLRATPQIVLMEKKR